MGKLFNNIVETVGRTPLVKLEPRPRKRRRDDRAQVRVLQSLGSVKDRIGMSMIEAAERDGKLKKETVIIEPTSGNTGIRACVCGSGQGLQIDPDHAGDDVARASHLARYAQAPNWCSRREARE
jgi:cysteine synthase A